jgi:hypothetical protein
VEFTTSPVGACSNNVSRPEFVTSAQAKATFGLGKSFLYLLQAEGRIKSVCIRKRGAARGKRLWDCGSIRAFLRANMEGGTE